jgi:hypothetical protein
MRHFLSLVLRAVGVLVLIGAAVYSFTDSSLIHFARDQAAISAALGLSAEQVARSVDTFTETDLELVQIVSATCHDPQGKYNGAMWGGVLVSNHNQKYWARASGVVAYQDVNQQVVGGFPFSDFEFPLNSQVLLIYSRTLNESRSLPLKAPYDSARLSFDNIQLGDPGPASEAYQVQVSVQSHTTTSAKYPAHTIVLNVENTGTDKLLHLKGTAAVMNSAGEVVDLLYTEKPGRLAAGVRLLPQKQQRFELHSLSKTGGCLGINDPTGYRLLYTISAITPYGEPLAFTEMIHLP